MIEGMYQYKECGLDNIYLVNGFTERETSRGKTVSIDNIEGLHRAIGDWLARHKKVLDGREARFLRVEMGLSQAMLALLLGKDEQSIARWEKKRLKDSGKIPGDSERMIRFLYLETVDKNTRLLEFLRALADLETIDQHTISFCETENVWEQGEQEKVA